MNSVKQLNSALFLVTVLALLLAGCGGAPGDNPNYGGSGEGVPSVRFVSASEDQLSIEGQGGAESSVLTFRVTNQDGEAISGERVDFALSETVGGVQLVTTSSQTDFSGEVKTTIRSGSTAVSVFVTATLASTGTYVFSDEITISTSGFYGQYFALGVETEGNEDAINGSFDDLSYFRNPLFRTDNEAAVLVGGASIINKQFNFNLNLRDQFGHAVRDGARVTIVSPQTGKITPSACVVSDGGCQVTWEATEFVDDGTTIIVMAYASGAEPFTDANGNNAYDFGEDFTDYPEAFADFNLNGIYDAGEYFVDANSNQLYDSEGNGVWDGPCVTGNCEGKASTIVWDAYAVLLLNHSEASE